MDGLAVTAGITRRRPPHLVTRGSTRGSRSGYDPSVRLLELLAVISPPVTTMLGSYYSQSARVAEQDVRWQRSEAPTDANDGGTMHQKFMVSTCCPVGTPRPTASAFLAAIGGYPPDARPRITRGAFDDSGVCRPS
jgi:hypothetical protein